MREWLKLLRSSPPSLLPRLRPVRALLTLVKALIVAVGSLEVLFLLLLAMTGETLQSLDLLARVINSIDRDVVNLFYAIATVALLAFAVSGSDHDDGRFAADDYSACIDCRPRSLPRRRQGNELIHTGSFTILGGMRADSYCGISRMAEERRGITARRYRRRGRVLLVIAPAVPDRLAAEGQGAVVDSTRSGQAGLCCRCRAAQTNPVD